MNSLLEEVNEQVARFGWEAIEAVPAPVNGETGKAYSGLSALLLRIAAVTKRYASPKWYTKDQCSKLALETRGQPSYAVFMQNRNGTPFVRWYPVFNEEQTDGELP